MVSKSGLDEAALLRRDGFEGRAVRGDFEVSDLALTPSGLSRMLREADEGRAGAYLDLAESMEEREAQYAAVLGVRKRQAAQLEVVVEPSGESAASMREADFVRRFFERSSLQEELVGILDAVGKGFSLTEVYWEASQRDWFPVRLRLRDPREVVFGGEGEAMLRGEDGEGRELPRWRFLSFYMNAGYGSPWRGGLARKAAWCYLFKKHTIRGWLEFAEIYGQPLRIGKYHAGASEEEKRTLLRAVTCVGRDAAAVVPEGMAIEFEGGGVRGGDGLYLDLARYMDHQISKIVLGQTTTTDAVAGGHAVSREQDKVRGDIERSDARALEGALQRGLADPMTALNFGAEARAPKVRLQRREATSVKDLATALERLKGSGLRASASEIRARLGLGAPKDEADVLEI